MTSPSAILWRRWTLAAMGALTTIVALWQLLPTPTVEHAVLAALCCIPILAPLHGLIRGERYTYRWSTFCVLPYFVIGVTEAIADPDRRIWSTAMLVVSLAWFASLIAYLRATSPGAQTQN